MAYSIRKDKIIGKYLEESFSFRNFAPNNNSMSLNKQYPIGKKDFANICNQNMVFIDKIHLIYDIVSKSEKCFFSAQENLESHYCCPPCDTILKAIMNFSKGLL